MKKILPFMFIFYMMVLVSNAQENDPFEPLRYLEGTWVPIKPDVTNTQTYRFIFNGKYLQMKTKGVFKPTENKPKGEIHEDIGFFSFDKIRKKLVLRSFHTEGFVNQYILKETANNGYKLIFITESVESAPPGTTAKLVFDRLSENELSQQFYIAWPDTEFSCYFDNRLLKLNNSK